MSSTEAGQLELLTLTLTRGVRVTPSTLNLIFWSATQTRATYGSLRGMPACVQAVDVVSATRHSSGVAPRACMRVYARVLVPPKIYIHTYILT